MAANNDPAVAFEQACDVSRLGGTVLDKERPIVVEKGGAVGRENTNGIKAVFAGSKCGLWFVLQLQKGFVVTADVGRVGDDDVELAAVHGCSPATQRKGHIAQ